MMQDWLQQSQSEGILHSQGRFSLDPDSAESLAGIARLTASDIPLLLLAGAVQAGSSYFRVYGRENLRLSWEGPTGPCGQMAHSLLTSGRIDFRWERDGLELPPAFWEYLDPLSRRCQHAPLDLIWGHRCISRAASGHRMVVTPKQSGRLLLVDRGVDFIFPAAFRGLDIVAWVDPLPGAPWPRRLLWSEALRHQLSRIARALALSEGNPKSEDCLSR
jgi:hypothetical protein